MGRMILNGTVYGAGSKVEANPSSTATDELKKIDIDGTIYNIAEGTINVYGAFIDTSKILLPETRISGNGSYTAQEDCFITLLYYLGNWATNVALDNENIISANNMTPNCWNYVIFPVKKEQELTYNLGYNGWLKIYGVKGGSNPISAPIIYSEEEREVGVWHDNKPLYEKGVIITGLGTSRGHTDFPLNVSNAEIKTVEGCYWYPDGTTRKYGDVLINASGVLDTSYTLQAQAINNNTIRITYAEDRSTSTGFVRVRYTKTTDVAGSSSYNTLGVPTVHYSTDEQVIGTWIDGKTIYQKTISISNLNYTSSGVNKVVDTIINIDMIVDLKGVLSNSAKTVRRMLPYINPNNTAKTAQIYYDYNNSNIIFNSTDTWTTAQLDVTVQYTKTTD